ncbi:MAG TPA: serine kinase [Nitrospirae bacterium]|nr:DRTGG domain protein [bacterium BMS3Abin06]HDH11759.1 serine kinase [Nitrospirota bacterium]HDZ02595.1 serine kinase [Nitrospirota bacterium]
MKLENIIDELSLDVKTCREGLRNEVKGVYVSDLLSDVMANSKEGDIWITLQTHLNIVAVAGLKNLAAIIIVNNRQPQEEILQKAEAEKVTIMTTPLPAFEAAGRLYQLLK